MIVLRTAASMREAVDGSLHPSLQAILARRIEQLSVGAEEDIGETVHFIIVEPGDQPAQLDRELGFSLFINPVDGTRFGEPDFTPSHEWTQDHGGWIEIVFMLTDAFGVVVFVEDDPGQHFDIHMYAIENAGRPL
jgi:hypothetical protein